MNKISRAFVAQWRLSVGISEKGFAFTLVLFANARSDFSVFDAAEMVLSLMEHGLLTDTVFILCPFERTQEDRRKRNRKHRIIFLQVSSFLLSYETLFLTGATTIELCLHSNRMTRRRALLFSLSQMIGQANGSMSQAGRGEMVET